MENFLRDFEQVSVYHLIAALIYVERLLNAAEEIAEHPELVCLTENNSKGVLHCAITIAVKFFTDKYEKKTHFYSQCLNTSMIQMRKMTDAFLGII